LEVKEKGWFVHGGSDEQRITPDCNGASKTGKEGFIGVKSGTVKTRHPKGKSDEKDSPAKPNRRATR
jgi:hypothetical protein